MRPGVQGGKAALWGLCDGASSRRGSLWAWGLNTTGQLGDGTQESRAEPGLVLFAEE